MGAISISREKAQPLKCAFPILMISQGGSIVLFDTPNSGICVHAAEGSLMTFGEYAGNRDIRAFAEFKGVIHLENE